MLSILQFIFSSFWVWLGTLILLLAIAQIFSFGKFNLFNIQLNNKRSKDGI